MKILWQYFLILIFYSLFYVSLILFYPYFLLFFLLHTRTLTFFFLFFLLSSFSQPLPPHTCPYLFSLFPSFDFFPTTSHIIMFRTELGTFFLFLFLFSFFLSPFSLTTSSASFFPSIPSKHTNFLGVLLIKTLPSKCIFQIILDINKIKKKKIYRVMCVEEDEERRRRGWCESELQGKAHSREFHQ